MKRIGWLVAVVWCVVCTRAYGQWVVQTVVVHEGWNAVSLQVEPEEGAMEKVVETVGAGNVEGIWRWDKRFSAAEYVVDEGTPLAKDPHWKVWYPGEELGALSTLGGLSGGQCYLVKVKEGTGEKTVQIKGKARMPRVEWYPNALNLVGFAVGENGGIVRGVVRGGRGGGFVEGVRQRGVADCGGRERAGGVESGGAEAGGGGSGVGAV